MGNASKGPGQQSLTTLACFQRLLAGPLRGVGGIRGIFLKTIARGRRLLALFGTFLRKWTRFAGQTAPVPTETSLYLREGRRACQGGAHERRACAGARLVCESSVPARPLQDSEALRRGWSTLGRLVDTHSLRSRMVTHGFEGGRRGGLDKDEPGSLLWGRRRNRHPHAFRSWMTTHGPEGTEGTEGTEGQI